MICYKDRTFCNFGCSNKDCPRNLTDNMRKEAEEKGLPISQYVDKPDCFEEKK